jgi:hypothetical protein
MNKQVMALGILIFQNFLMASEIQYRRESDSATWVLTIADAKYMIIECALNGKTKQDEGVVLRSEGCIKLKDSRTNSKQSVVHGKCFVERNVAAGVFLVDKGREDEFNRALSEADQFMQKMILRGFFLRSIR